MPKINKTKYAILGLLKLEPGSGYDIKKKSDEGVSYFWNENYGHIYPVLKKMEEEGLVEKEMILSTGKPAKQIYYITPKGEQELDKWLALPVEYSPGRDELLLKLYFSGEAPLENIIEKIKTERELASLNLSQYTEIENNLKLLNIENKQKSLLWLSTLRRGIHFSKASINWADETLEELYKLKEVEEEK